MFSAAEEVIRPDKGGPEGAACVYRRRPCEQQTSSSELCVCGFFLGGFAISTIVGVDRILDLHLFCISLAHRYYSVCMYILGCLRRK